MDITTKKLNQIMNMLSIIHGENMFLISTVRTLIMDEETKKIIKKYEDDCNSQMQLIISGMYDDEINIGDTVKVIDNDYSPALHLIARIGRLELSFTDYRQNKCILTNFKEVKSGILSIDTMVRYQILSIPMYLMMN